MLMIPLLGDQDLSPPPIRGSIRAGVGVGGHGTGRLCHGNQPSHSPTANKCNSNQSTQPTGHPVGQVRGLPSPWLVTEMAYCRVGCLEVVRGASGENGHLPSRQLPTKMTITMCVWYSD